MKCRIWSNALRLTNIQQIARYIQSNEQTVSDNEKKKIDCKVMKILLNIFSSTGKITLFRFAVTSFFE